MRPVLNLWFLNIQLVHMFRIPRPEEIMGVSLHMLRVLHLLEKRRGMPGIVGVILHMLRVPHLLEKGGGMPHPSSQTRKAPSSEGVSMEEFIDDISKSKRKHSYALPWKLRSLPLIKRQLTHQTTKSGCMP